MSRLPVLLPVEIGGNANSLPVTFPVVFGTEFVESSPLSLTASTSVDAGFIVFADCELSATATFISDSALTKYSLTYLQITSSASGDMDWIPGNNFGDIQVAVTATAEVTRFVPADSVSTEVTAAIESEVDRVTFGDSATGATASFTAEIHRDVEAEAEVHVTADFPTDLDDYNFGIGTVDVTVGSTAAASLSANADSALGVYYASDPEQKLTAFVDADSRLAFSTDESFFYAANASSDLLASANPASGFVLAAKGNADLAAEVFDSTVANSSLIADALETSITGLLDQAGNVSAVTGALTNIAVSITASDSTSAVAQAVTAVTAAVSANANALAVAQSFTAVTAVEQAVVNSHLYSAAATHVEVAKLSVAIAQKILSAQTHVLFAVISNSTKPLILVSVKPDIRNVSVSFIDRSAPVPVSVRSVEVVPYPRRSDIQSSSRGSQQSLSR